MNFDLTDDQRALQDGVRTLCEGRFASARVRAGFERGMWTELEDAGVFSLRDDGFGWADAAIVVEQLGRAVVPGPVVWGILAHGVMGGVVGGVERPAGGVAIIEHLAEIDTLVVLDADGLFGIDPSGLEADAVRRPLDPLTPVHRVALPAAGEPLADGDTAAAWRMRGAVLTAAFALGIADASGDLAVAYAKEREQFDRPIGSFQAIKHLCADMAVRTEVARAAVYSAAVHLDDAGAGDQARAVSGAKLLAGEAAIANGRAATQVLGGMGYTWEVDAHLYLKRAWVLETHFGSGDRHADAVFATVEARS